MTAQTMTSAAFAELCIWLEDRFHGTRNYRSAAAVYADFAYYHPVDIRSAAQNLYRQGRKTAPTFSELLAEVSKISQAKHGAGYSTQNPADRCFETRHTWAIVAEHQADGTILEWAADRNRERTGLCAVCGEERRFPAGQLVTSTEIAEREKHRQASYSGDRSDRIAP